MNILIVLTSHDQLGNTGNKTGFWLEEFASPYYCLKDAGATITLASPLGGQPPLDPKSNEADFQTADTKRFDNDEETQQLLANTQTLANINTEEYDAVFYPGGHGPLWDLYNDAASVKLIEQFIAQNKPVATVCHASAVLLNAKTSQGEAIVKNRKVTGFSNTEEEAVGLTDIVPYLLEDELTKQGATYQKGDDWSSFVVVDNNLITGQNPGSSFDVAKALLGALAK